MQSNNLKKLRIFAASPSDVASERAKLETVVALLKPLADYLSLTLEVVDWRGVVPEAGRPQQIIFDQLKPTSWDIFVGILWHRFGTPPGAKDKAGKDYLSGTEEEFKTAYELWRQYGKPRILIYRCTRSLPYDIDPDQLKRVREFFKLIDDVKGDYPTLYQTFDTTELFEKLLLDNLQKLLIEYGEQSRTPITPDVAQVLAPKIPNNLPRRAAFFGRAREMDVVMRALSPADRTWGVLIYGIGGIGKTALAIEAAHRMQEAGAFDAFVFISAKQNVLKPSGTQGLIPAAHTLDDFLNETAHVLGQSGIPKLSSDEKRRALLDVLRTMRALLIYDNLETLSEDEQKAMANFLHAMPPACKAIITSRQVILVEGGMSLELGTLDWDAACGIIENEMARDARLANKLHCFESRWQELYDETNGSPLALVHTLGLMRVRATLTFDSALEMLRGNRDADLQNFIFQEARKELTENDKIALGALSFFVPSATFEAWMQVANLSRDGLEITIDRMGTLSLVDVLAGEERYALHPITRAFVRSKLLADVNVEREMGMKFAWYWVDYAKQYGSSTRNYATFNQLEVEWANLDEVGNWLREIAFKKDGTVDDRGAARMLVDLADALSGFLWYCGRWDERIQLGTWAYEAGNALKERKSAGWRAYDVTSVHLSRGHVDDAANWADKCAKAWLRSNGKREQGFSKRLRGLVSWQRKDYKNAEQLLQQALKIWRTVRQHQDKDQDIITGLISMGELAQERKDYNKALKNYNKAFKLAKKIDDKELQARISGKFGKLELDCKQWAKARESFDQEFRLAKEIGRQTLIAHAQHGLACVHEAEGRTDLALSLAQESLKIYQRLQHKDLMGVRELVERLTTDLNKKQN